MISQRYKSDKLFTNEWSEMIWYTVYTIHNCGKSWLRSSWCRNNDHIHVHIHMSINKRRKFSDIHYFFMKLLCAICMHVFYFGKLCHRCIKQMALNIPRWWSPHIIFGENLPYYLQYLLFRIPEFSLFTDHADNDPYQYMFITIIISLNIK